MKTVSIKTGENNFLIRANDVAGVMQASSNDETRNYLRGVYVESKEGGVHLTTTDGQILLTKESEKIAFIGGNCRGIFGNEEGFILSIDITEKAFKAKPKGDLWINGDVETGICEFVSIEGEIKNEEVDRVGVCQFEITDGTFPDYLRAIPEARRVNILDETMPVIGFDANCIATLLKALKITSGNNKAGVITFQSPTTSSLDPILITFKDCPKLKGVLMPSKIT